MNRKVPRDLLWVFSTNCENLTHKSIAIVTDILNGDFLEVQTYREVAEKLGDKFMFGMNSEGKGKDV